MFMYSDYSQHLLDNVKKIHFIGCGGSGMYPLIQILAAKGYELSGSDVLDGSIIRYEREMGVKVSLGHNADNVVGADMVVANNLKVAGAGFGVDTNVVTFITPDGTRELPLMSKADVADAILDEILQRRAKK